MLHHLRVPASLEIRIAASDLFTLALASRKSSLSTGAACPGGGRCDLRCRELGRELLGVVGVAVAERVSLLSPRAAATCLELI